jgi:hypothetical protein
MYNKNVKKTKAASNFRSIYNETIRSSPLDPSIAAYLKLFCIHTSHLQTLKKVRLKISNDLQKISSTAMLHIRILIPPLHIGIGLLVYYVNRDRSEKALITATVMTARTKST